MKRPLLLALLFVLLAGVRLSGPTDLLEGDQVKQVGYVMDILHHDAWLVQYEITGEIATKPPLYNWLAAAFCKVTGSRAEWVIKLPALLAGAGLLVCIYLLGCRFFDEWTAFYACAACLASHHFSKLFWFARTDMLMACLTYVAITLVVSLRPSWWKGLLIGLVVGLDALAKGPIGPTLFCIFLLVWGWREDLLRRRAAWRQVAAGCAVFALVFGAWLVAVWNAPGFRETVIGWQLGSRMVEARVRKPVYYFVGHLFSRIAPWTLVAIAGAALARRRREDWRTARFLLWWGGLFFLFFSLIPIKRHDHLLPVYPVVFLLAGHGLRRLLQPVVAPESAWLMYPLAGFLLVSPLIVTLTDSPEAALLAAGACACGAAALVCYVLHSRTALVVAAAGLICIHGVYHHWGHQAERAHYADLLAFVDAVEAHTCPEDRLLVFQAHPLIAYELGLHDRLPNAVDMAGADAEWLIAPAYHQPMIEQATNWKLEPRETMRILPRKDQATLFHVERGGRGAVKVAAEVGEGVNAK